jgi:hypothetical protein
VFWKRASSFKFLISLRQIAFRPVDCQSAKSQTQKTTGRKAIWRSDMRNLKEDARFQNTRSNNCVSSAVLLSLLLRPGGESSLML